jgi:5-methylcytosine-specific restriction enzyme B
VRGERAWLVRARARGRDRLPRWLEESYVAIGWYELGIVPAGTPRSVLLRRAADAYPTRSAGSLRNAVGNIDRFVSRMDVGDLVAVPDGPEVFLARVVSDARHVPGHEEAHRRDVDWIAPSAPLLRHELSGGAQARLRTMLTVTDITAIAVELLRAQGELAG